MSCTISLIYPQPSREPSHIMNLFRIRTFLLALLGLQLAALSAGAWSAQDYTTFSTDDEANNIEVFKEASPSVVYITNSRLVRRSFYSLNPQEVPQGSGSG